MKIIMTKLTLALCLLGAAQAQAASVYITEWMYKGEGGEFIELTNLSSNAIDFSAWSYDDDSRTPGTFDLSGFGLVAAGESVIFTEATAADFRAEWGLDSSVKVLGEVSNNIGRGDEINIYGGFNGSGFALIDSLTYGDDDIPGSIRTNGASGNPGSFAALGANEVLLWELSFIGDDFNSWQSLNGDIGNPGSYSAVPLPGSAWMLGFGLAILAAQRRKLLK